MAAIRLIFPVAKLKYWIVDRSALWMKINPLVDYGEIVIEKGFENPGLLTALCGHSPDASILFVVHQPAVGGFNSAPTKTLPGQLNRVTGFFQSSSTTLRLELK